MKSNMKYRWKEAAELAAAFELKLLPDDPMWAKTSKWLIQTHLLNKIKELGLYERMIACDDNAWAEFLATDTWQAFRSKNRTPKLRLAQEPKAGVQTDPEGRKFVVNQKGENMYETDILRLALWFVNMCGGDSAIAQRAVIAAGGSKGIII